MKGIEIQHSSYYLRRRVPSRYAPVEPRKIIKHALNTDSIKEAAAKAEIVWKNLIDGWEARLAGDTSDAEARFAAARSLAHARGLRFMQARKVAAPPDDQLLKRIDMAMETAEPGKPDVLAAQVILGVIEPPKLVVSKALEAFEKVAKDRTLGKSEDQVRRWRNPRKKALTNFAEVVGDKPVSEITTEDMWAFREWWVDKLDEEQLTANSANKDFTYVKNIFKTIARPNGITLGYNAEGIAIKEGKKRQRPAFSRDWIGTKLLAPGALDGLNLEARCLLLGMVNTGYRPSEAQFLKKKHIRLDADVPHISIEPEDRTLKNHHSERIIPLVGVSLEAFRACPEGFTRYGKKVGVTDTINKFLTENKLRETPAHSLYSLRHSFEDRMLSAGIDERIRRDLFGHALNREKYGQGADLAHIRRLLEPVAL